MDELGLVRIGIVSEIDPSMAMVKVTFDDLTSDDSNGLLSDWLAVGQHGSTEDAGYWLPNIGAQVVCVMLSNGVEEGVVISTLYNDEDVPHTSGAGRWYKKFSDGSVIEYDPSLGFKIETGMKVVIKGAAVEIN